jgi:hypothetical protein
MRNLRYFLAKWENLKQELESATRKDKGVK